MKTRLRPMQERDFDWALLLAEASIEAPQWTRSDYGKLLGREPEALLMAGCWVAELEGERVGFAVARWLRGEPAADVESVVVGERYRRQGIGAALVRACMQWAAAGGAAAIVLEVRASNAAALALYARLGFAQAGMRRAYYSAPVEDALVLQASCLRQTPLEEPAAGRQPGPPSL